MKLERLLSSPPPTTAWSVDGEVLAAVRRDRQDVLHGAVQAVPPETFEEGPVGLQSVDPARLEPVVRSLQERVAGAKRAAVVLPTSWLRSHLLDFDQLPRKRAEVADVIRWRLKRLLPVPPSELRISWVQVAGPDGVRRVLTAVAFRRAVDTLEEVFVAAGVPPGLITSRLFAAATAAREEYPPSLFVQGEPGFLSLLLVTDGAPRLLRTKPLRSVAAADGVDRELALALHFIRDTLGVREPLEVRISVHDPGLGDAIRGWAESADGLRPVPSSARFELAEPGVADQVGEARLRPLETVIGGSS